MPAGILHRIELEPITNPWILLKRECWALSCWISTTKICRAVELRSSAVIRPSARFFLFFVREKKSLKTEKEKSKFIQSAVDDKLFKIFYLHLQESAVIHAIHPLEQFLVCTRKNRKRGPVVILNSFRMSQKDRLSAAYEDVRTDDSNTCWYV